jgi:hypothetical protein
MYSTPPLELIPVLQVAIGPVILISGVGLLLLTLTNRFGRAVDRALPQGDNDCHLDATPYFDFERSRKKTLLIA